MFGNDHASIGTPGLSGMTSNLGSLNLNAAPLSSASLSMGNPLVGSKAPMPGMESTSGGLPHGGLGSSMQSPTQTPFSPMGGSNAVDAMRSRTASFADSDPMSAFAGMRPSSSLSQRVPGYRAGGAPTPIGPIGRPKAMDAIHQHPHDDHTGAIGNGRSSSSASGSGATSPRLPEGILGSSALGGDDDIIEPKPRRTSHTIPIGGGATGSSMGSAGSFFGGMGSAGGVAGGFGVNSPSPWTSFSGGSQGAPGPLSPGFNAGGAPGAGSIGSNLSSANFGATPGLGSNAAGLSGGAQPDPWARVSSGWDRARYAFEQPGGSGGGSGAGAGGLGAMHAGAPGHHGHVLGAHAGSLHPMALNAAQGGSAGNAGANGGMLGPFGLGAPGSGGRNLFGAPGSNAMHPGYRLGALAHLAWRAPHERQPRVVEPRQRRTACGGVSQFASRFALNQTDRFFSRRVWRVRRISRVECGVCRGGGSLSGDVDCAVEPDRPTLGSQSEASRATAL